MPQQKHPHRNGGRKDDTPVQTAQAVALCMFEITFPRTKKLAQTRTSAESSEAFSAKNLHRNERARTLYHFIRATFTPPPPFPREQLLASKRTSLLVVDVRTPEAESLSRLGWYTSLAIMFSGSVTFRGTQFFATVESHYIGAMIVSNTKKTPSNMVERTVERQNAVLYW